MKDYLDLLNDAKLDLDEYSNEELNDIEKKKLKDGLRRKIHKKKNNNYKKIVIASTFIIAILAVTNYEAIADKIEKLVSKNPIENFENYSGVSANNYRNIVDKSVTNNGLTITINELIFDYKNILITYTLSSEEIDTKNIDLTPKIYIDGKELKRRGVSSTYSDKNQDLKQFTLEPRTPITKVGEFDVKIVIGGKDDFSQDEIIENGKWEFNFKANNIAINEAIQIYNVDKDISLDNGRIISMNNIVVTPVSTTVEYSIENFIEGDLDDNMSIACIVEDSKGNILETISQHFSYNYLESKGSSVSRYRNVSEDLDSIKVTPIVLYNSSYDKNLEENKKLEKYSVEIDI